MTSVPEKKKKKEGDYSNCMAEEGGGGWGKRKTRRKGLMGRRGSEAEPGGQQIVWEKGLAFKWN